MEDEKKVESKSTNKGVKNNNKEIFLKAFSKIC